MVAPHRILSREARELIAQAQTALGLSQEGLGAKLGSSKRTVSRWASSRSAPSMDQVQTLARLVHPVNPTLAAGLAEASGETLQSLGIVEPAPPPAPAQPSVTPVAPPARVVVQAVVCAAAEALQATPSTVRPAILAAFRTARELGMSVEDVERALGTGS